MAAQHVRLDSVIDPTLRAQLPRSAPYLNEANYAQPDLVAEAFGLNLARLRRVKRKFDPRDLFYALYGVGSDAWAPDANGRLCRTR